MSSRRAWALFAIGLAACAAPPVPGPQVTPAASPMIATGVPLATPTATPVASPPSPTPRPTIDPRATVGPSDEFVLPPSYQLRIASDAMSAAVGSTIRLSAQDAFSGGKVAGKAGWTIDPATAANGRVIDLDDGQPGSPCDVMITAPGPVVVHAQYGNKRNTIVLAGTSAPVADTALLMTELGFLPSGVRPGCCSDPEGVFVIVTPDDWTAFLKLVVEATPSSRDRVPGLPPPVDLAAASLVVLAATYPYPYSPPVLTRVDPTPPGLVEVVQTHQDFLAPPPSAASSFWQLHAVPKLSAGAQARVVCDDGAKWCIRQGRIR